MKTCYLIGLFCLLSVILCDTHGVTVEALKASFKDGLNFIKAFHKKTYNLGKIGVTRATLTNPLLTEKNIDFKVESGLVRVLFQNIKLTLSGSAKIQKSQFKEYTNFGAHLESFKYELGYTVSSNKLTTGHYEVKYSKTSETGPSFNIVKLTSKFTGLPDIDEQLKNKIKALDFTPYKEYLKKIANLALETLPNHMK